MKTRFYLAAVLAGMLCVASASAQGTLQFIVGLNGSNVVPPSGSTATGTGTFTLDGVSFGGGIFMRNALLPTIAGIHGPAGIGTNISALFQMSGPGIVAPDSNGDPGGVGFSISTSLTQSQIADLRAGLWYVNVRSDAFPNGEIRGQILAVPEPSVTVLFGLGTGLLTLSTVRKFRRRIQTAS